MSSGFFPELFCTYIAQGIEAGFTFFLEWIAAPVQVSHAGILSLTSCIQKTDYETDEHGTKFESSGCERQPDTISTSDSPSNLNADLPAFHEVISHKIVQKTNWLLGGRRWKYVKLWPGRCFRDPENTTELFYFSRLCAERKYTIRPPKTHQYGVAQADPQIPA